MGEEVGTLDVRVEATVDAPAERVWQAVLRVGEWWPHRVQPDGRVALEPWVGGRFMEDWGDEGGGVLYGWVTRLAPGSRLAVSGPMGISGAVTSVWTLDLEDAGERTVVRVAHTALGEIGDDTRRAYTTGWDQVLQSLATATEASPRASLRGRASF